MRSTVTGVLAILLANGCPVSTGQGDAVKEEMQRLQGTWRIASLKWMGKEAKAEDKKPGLFVFKGDKIIMPNDMDMEDIMPYRLDPTKDPKHIEWGHDPDRRIGIYKLEGDALTVCILFPLAADKARPTKFEADRAGRTFLMVFERQKGK